MELDIRSRRRRRPVDRLVTVACVLVTLLGVAFLVPSLLGYQRYVITGTSMTGTIDLGSVAFERVVPVADLAGRRRDHLPAARRVRPRPPGHAPHRRDQGRHVPHPGRRGPRPRPVDLPAGRPRPAARRLFRAVRRLRLPRPRRPDRPDGRDQRARRPHLPRSRCTSWSRACAAVPRPPRPAPRPRACRWWVAEPCASVWSPSSARCSSRATRSSAWAGPARRGAGPPPPRSPSSPRTTGRRPASPSPRSPPWCRAR